MLKQYVAKARYGLKDWLVQRVTGIYMALFTLVFAVCTLFYLPAFTYDAWSGLFSSSCVKFFSFLFILSLCYHVWIGIRDVWMDYIKHAGLRLALHLITLFLLVGYAGWAVRILWRLQA
jgi:succinate dehydrogenase / fumarate reductase membrane anchor subunit